MLPTRPTAPVAVDDAIFESLLSSACALPLASPLVPTILSLLDDPQSGLSEITRTINQDPTLALRVLRLVNSAYFALQEPVTQIGKALQLIGVAQIRDLLDAQSLLMFFALRPRSRPAVGARIAGLWQHAVATGIAARELARHIGAKDVMPYYAAGLLHDVGKVALLLLRGPDYERCLWLAASENLPVVEAERRLLEFDHAQLGKRICQFWGQPEEIAQAIGRHHSVRSSNDLGVYNELTAIIHVADILARTFGLGWWGDRVMPRLDQAARSVLRLRAEHAVDLLEAIEAQYPTAFASLSAIFGEVEIS